MEICCLNNLVKRGLHSLFHELRLKKFSNRLYSHFIHKIGITLWALRTLMQSLQENPYCPSPGISWKAQKDQVNTIFPSTFWLKKDHVSHHWKVQNKNISVIIKYHLSIIFLAHKKTVFPISQKFKPTTFQ